MDRAYLLVESYGATVVLVFVFLRQAGLPLPGIPGLLFFGSQIGAGRLRPVDALLAGLAGCVAADVLWFRLGRAMGPRVLTLLSKLSLESDPNVDAVEERFRRLGLKSLLVSKFIPWFDMIAPPVAGMLGAPYALFVPWTAGGGLLWLLVYGGLGVVFSDRIADVIAATRRWVGPVGWTAAALFAAFLAWKYVQRRRALERRASRDDAPTHARDRGRFVPAPASSGVAAMRSERTALSAPPANQCAVVGGAIDSSPSGPLSRDRTPRESGNPQEI